MAVAVSQAGHGAPTTDHSLMATSLQEPGALPHALANGTRNNLTAATHLQLPEQQDQSRDEEVQMAPERTPSVTPGSDEQRLAVTASNGLASTSPPTQEAHLAHNGSLPSSLSRSAIAGQAIQQDPEYHELSEAIRKAKPDVVQQVVRDQYQKSILGSPSHAKFILDVGFSQASDAQLLFLLEHRRSNLAKVLKLSIIQQMSAREIDEFSDSILAKCSNSFLDKGLAKRLETIQARTLVNALARAERLGYNVQDIVEEKTVPGGTEHVVPSPAPWPAAHETSKPTASPAQPPAEVPRGGSVHHGISPQAASPATLAPESSAVLARIVHCQRCNWPCSSQEALRMHSYRNACDNDRHMAIQRLDQDVCVNCGIMFAREGQYKYHVTYKVCGRHEPAVTRKVREMIRGMSTTTSNPTPGMVPGQPTVSQPWATAAAAPLVSLRPEWSRPPAPSPWVAPAYNQDMAAPAQRMPLTQYGPLPTKQMTVTATQHLMTATQQHTTATQPKKATHHTTKAQQHTPATQPKEVTVHTTPAQLAAWITSSETPPASPVPHLKVSPSGDPYASLNPQTREFFDAEMFEAEEKYGDLMREATTLPAPQRDLELHKLRNRFNTRQSSIRRKFGVLLRGRRLKAEINEGRRHLRAQAAGAVSSSSPASEAPAAKRARIDSEARSMQHTPRKRVAVSDMSGGLAGSPATAEHKDPTLFSATPALRSSVSTGASTQASTGARMDPISVDDSGDGNDSSSGSDDDDDEGIPARLPTQEPPSSLPRIASGVGV